MIKVNIKTEVKELEESGVKYETQVTPFYRRSFLDRIKTFFTGTNNAPLTHKHIFIPALNKHYVRTNDLEWYTGKCDMCK